MGASFLALSLCRAAGYDVSPNFIVCYAVSAVFFALFDVWSFFHNMVSKNTGGNLLIKLGNKDIIGEMLIYVATLFIIVVPHLIDKNASWLTGLGDFSTLFALGLVMLLMGTKKLREGLVEQKNKDSEIEFLKQQITTLQAELAATKEDND